MDIQVIGLVVLGVAVVGLAFVYVLMKKQLADEQQKRGILEGECVQLRRRIEEIGAEQDELLVRKTEAETRLVSLRERLEGLEVERLQTSKEKDALVEEKNRYQREEELAKQRIATITKEMQDWQKTKEQHLEIAKASVLEAGSKLSSKLLDDHKRELEEAKKDSEKRVKETTEELHTKFQNVFESMSTLHDKVNKSSDTVDLVKRSLLSPSGAGALSEITLSNIFKASGLTEGRDYKMQYSVDNQGKSLRPDAVVFLPGNAAMVIDSKASKFFLEYGEAEGDTVRQKEVEDGLKRTMNQHLKDLVSRNYKDAVKEDVQSENVTVLMFVPTEVALERLYRIDPKFRENAWRENILPVSPTGLVSALLQAELLITNAQQDQNTKAIIAEVRDLLGSVAKLHELAGQVGKGLKSAFGKYDEFAGSFNRMFLSKAKKIDKLGAGNPKIKEIKQLDRYNIDSREYKEIEADFAEAEDVKELAYENE